MGNEASRTVGEFVNCLNDGPDLGVDRRLQKFTGLASLENLKQHYETRRMEVGDFAADWIKALAEKLAAFGASPAWGLGALAIAVLIDVLSYRPSEESIKEALRCVFAEEKAFEVWDLIDECLKRCSVNIDNKTQMRSDIEQLEVQLSLALTKLKNSMLRDGHMSNQAVKVWVNGAAFHLQMLIHLVRLEGKHTVDPIKRLISVYQRDLDTICDQHEEMVKKRKVRYEIKGNNYGSLQNFVDEDSKRYRLAYGLTYKECVEAYYNHRYGRLKPDTKKYLSDVEKDLPMLVLQTGSFQIH